MSSKPKIKKPGAGLPAPDANWKKLLAAHPESFSGKKKKVTQTQVKDQPAPPKIWFDNVDPIHLDPNDLGDYKHKDVEAVMTLAGKSTKCTALEKQKGTKGLTKLVAMDCEMVGVGDDGTDSGSIVARVTIVNHFRKVIYDKFVKPTETVVNYRTFVSGVRPSDLENGEDFKIVQKEVADILKNRILVGHAVYHDLKVLFLGHPRRDIRDTSRYKPFKELFDNRTPSLKKLTEKVLGVKIQDGEHDSVQDAQAAMRLYTMHRIEWENSLRRLNRTNPKSKTAKKDGTADVAEIKQKTDEV